MENLFKKDFNNANVINLLKFMTVLAYDKQFLSMYFNNSTKEQKQLKKAKNLYNKYLYLYYIDYLKKK